MLDIISAIRKMCEPESGFVDLFNKNKSYDTLLSLTDDKIGAELFSKLIYGRARGRLLTLINDAYEYEKYSDLIVSELVADGLPSSDAKATLETFFRAFGFPGYRDVTINPVTEFVSYEKENFKTVYKGETKDGKEYGIGIRNNFFEGESCGFDECVWISGRMLGYCHSLDIEFGAYKTQKYGFVLNDTYVGKYMTIYEDGEKGYMTSENLAI
ncbi:MAG: hypothetical protein IKJ07_03650 [Clostridia bacterium]|nr:hypothetical protein [Clostridia bacterium]